MVLDKFVEAGACGTAAVISPIGGVQHGDDFHVFYSETEVGPVTRKLYDELTGIQFISGAIMLGFGAMRGETETVLSKAIRLCLECVGIG